MQVLNLDDLAEKVTRSVILKGITYEIKEMSVEGFIRYTGMAKDVELKAKSATGDQVTQSVEMAVLTIGIALPKIPAAQLSEMNLVQLMTLIQFINGELDKDQAATSTVEGEPAKKS